MNRLGTIAAFAALLIAFVSDGALAGARNAGTATSPEATGMLARYRTFVPQFAHNPFGRPLALESQESTGQVSGDVYAEIDKPFAVVSKAFASAPAWCEVLILHINTKYCRTGLGAEANNLSVWVGRKHEQDLDNAFAMRFAFRLDAARPDYLAAQITSPDGPFGSHDYAIRLQAVPVAGGKTFMRLHYAYSFGRVARLATEGYLATSGSDKVGFSRVDTGDGKRDYVRGMRGTIERNTMRYYLAVEAYLDSLSKPPGQQFASRIEHWFDATEQYRLQLHEMDRSTYLSMKQREYVRQQSAAVH